jgi:hypothetical protein
MAYSEAIPMSDCIARIEKMANGYEVEIRDPKIAAENVKPRSSWQDPMRSYAFKNAEEVGTFLTSILDKLAPIEEDEFAAAFKAATSADNDEDD